MRDSDIQGCACPWCLEAAERTQAAPPVLPGGAQASKPVYSDERLIFALTTMDGRHGSAAWDGGAVSYSIGTGPLVPGHPDWVGEYAGYTAMTPAMVRAAAEAAELWDDVVAIDLVERANDPSADIALNYSGETGNATYTRSSYVRGGDRADYGLAYADVWLAAGWPTHDQDSDLHQGGYGVLTYLHEIGHALGLSHPGPYDSRASFAADATHFQDTRAYTVMSYFDAEENGSGTDHVGAEGHRYAATPLLNDILAAQAIYGADMTTRTGPTTYGFGSNAGRAAFDFARNPDPVVAIWDAGGVDRIDVSGWDTDQVIDLRAGAFSSVGYLSHNLAIAHGTVIEEAVAGGGDDLLIGNAASNTLVGGEGDDRLHGRAGSDVLLGGAGDDYMAGGSGNDAYAVADAGDEVFERDGGGVDQVFASRDYALPPGVEHLVMTGTQVEGRGNALDNRIVGNPRDNIIEGAGGDDLLTGGGGSDRFVFMPGFGVDRVLDFTPGPGTPDALVFSSDLFASVAGVMAGASQVGSDAWIGDELGNTVILEDVELLALDPDDFGFV